MDKSCGYGSHGNRVSSGIVYLLRGAFRRNLLAMSEEETVKSQQQQGPTQETDPDPQDKVGQAPRVK